MFLIDPLKIILKLPLSGCEVEHACKDNHSICNIIRAFLSRMLNILAFTISKSYFINFNIPLYNPPNIKTSIILPLHLNILFYSFFMFSLFFLFMFSNNYH